MPQPQAQRDVGPFGNKVVRPIGDEELDFQVWVLRSRKTTPASVSATRRVVRRSSFTPSRPSRLATIRDTEGCDRPNSRATFEKLPVSAARTNTESS